MASNRSRLSPSRTVITSFTPRKSSGDAYEDGDWVLDVQALGGGGGGGSGSSTSGQGQQQQSPAAVACSLSNGQVVVYDEEHLQPTATWTVHPGTVATELAGGGATALVWAAASDGSLWGWDRRMPSAAAAVHMQLPPGGGVPATTLSVGFHGSIVAVGMAKEHIHFVDARQTKHVVGTYADAHTDAVNCVRFVDANNQGGGGSDHANASAMGATTLLSAGEDGLVNVFDTRQPTEETALSAVWNVGAPVRRVGLCNDNSCSSTTTPPMQQQQQQQQQQKPIMYAITGNETISLFDCQASQCVAEFGYGLRQELAQKAGMETTIDYLVDAHWDGAQLFLLAGNAVGDAGYFRLQRTANQNLTWEPCCRILTGGHKGVIRGFVPSSSSSNNSSGRLLTAGEDARICEWDLSSTTTANAGSKINRIPVLQQRQKLDSPVERPGGGPLRKRQQNRNRFRVTSSPY